MGSFAVDVSGRICIASVLGGVPGKRGSRDGGAEMTQGTAQQGGIHGGREVGSRDRVRVPARGVRPLVVEPNLGHIVSHSTAVG